MNKKQWFALGIGLLIFGSWMTSESSFWLKVCLPSLNNVACMTRNIYGMLSRVSGFLGLICIICGWLEK